MAWAASDGGHDGGGGRAARRHLSPRTRLPPARAEAARSCIGGPAQPVPARQRRARPRSPPRCWPSSWARPRWDPRPAPQLRDLPDAVVPLGLTTGVSRMIAMDQDPKPRSAPRSARRPRSRSRPGGGGPGGRPFAGLLSGVLTGSPATRPTCWLLLATLPLSNVAGSSLRHAGHGGRSPA